VTTLDEVLSDRYSRRAFLRTDRADPVDAVHKIEV
jgi:hypothetical protein